MASTHESRESRRTSHESRQTSQTLRLTYRARYRHATVLSTVFEQASLLGSTELTVTLLQQCANACSNTSICGQTPGVLTPPAVGQQEVRTRDLRSNVGTQALVERLSLVTRDTR